MSVLCIGQLVADIVVRPVAGLPAPGRCDLVDDLQLLSGGCAANTACALAKLGAETRLLAVIGQDALGDAALADLKLAGVGVEAVVREPAVPTAAAIVLVGDTGERSFWYRPGGNERLANGHVSDALLKAAQNRTRRRCDEAVESRPGRGPAPGEIVRLRDSARHRLGRSTATGCGDCRTPCRTSTIY